MTFTASVRSADITHIGAYRLDHAYVQLQLGGSHVYINGRLGSTGHAEQIADIRQVLTGLLTALDAIDPANGDQDEYYVPWSLAGAHDPRCATAYGGACSRLAGCPDMAGGAR